MKLTAYLATLGAILPASLAATKYYNLKTALKAGQSGKAVFDNLYLEAFHSGAGFNDAVLTTSKAAAIKGYLVKTNATANNGHSYYNQQFDLASNQPPYSMIMDTGVNTYASWQPVSIDAGGIDEAGSAYNGFFIDSNGLEWSSSPPYPKSNEFGGWLGKI